MHGIDSGIEGLKKTFENKHVLFIATTYTDYLRVQQEVSLLKRHAKSVKIITYSNKKYWQRLLKIYIKLLFFSLKKYDLIVLGFAPQLVLPIFSFRFRNKKVVSDFFISFYDTLVNDRKRFKPESLVAKMLHKLDRFTIAKSDELIVDTRAHGQYFLNEFSENDIKSHVLYLEADSRYYYERDQIKPLNLKDKYIVLYFGTVLPLQGVEVVLESMKQLGDDKKIHFVFIGPLPKDLKSIVDNSPNITMFEWLDQEKLADWISVSDLCLAGHFNGEIKKAQRTIPGKAYIYEAMGKKMILGDCESNKERYPEQYSNVEFVGMGSGTELAHKIKQICREVSYERE